MVLSREDVRSSTPEVLVRTPTKVTGASSSITTSTVETFLTWLDGPNPATATTAPARATRKLEFASTVVATLSATTANAAPRDSLERLREDHAFPVPAPSPQTASAARARRTDRTTSAQTARRATPEDVAKGVRMVSSGTRWWTEAGVRGASVTLTVHKVIAVTP